MDNHPQDPSSPEDSLDSNPSDPTRNVASDVQHSATNPEPPRARIIEDVLIVDTNNPSLKTVEPESPHGKMVPPLRLKKIGVTKQHHDDQPTSEPRLQEVESKSTADSSSKYCIIAPKPTTPTPTKEVVLVNGNGTMGAQKNDNAGCTGKSIEIVIPSVPELGIKETRTDRISVQEPTQKPFVVNYILGQEIQ